MSVENPKIGDTQINRSVLLKKALSDMIKKIIRSPYFVKKDFKSRFLRRVAH